MGGKRCCVCRSGASSSIHQFPKDDKLRSAWLQRLGIPESAIKPMWAVCSDHFDSRCFEQRLGRTVLKKGALPKPVIRRNLPLAPKPLAPSISLAPNTSSSNEKCAPTTVYLVPANSLQCKTMPLVLKALGSIPSPVVLVPAHPYTPRKSTNMDLPSLTTNESPDNQSSLQFKNVPLALKPPTPFISTAVGTSTLNEKDTPSTSSPGSSVHGKCNSQCKSTNTDSSSSSTIESPDPDQLHCKNSPVALTDLRPEENDFTPVKLQIKSTPLPHKYKRTAKTTLRYIGDFSPTELDSPETAMKFALLVKEKLGEKNHALRTLRQSNDRLEKRIASLKAKIKELRRKNSAARNDPATLFLFNPMD